MAKLKGKEKEAFLARMAKGRKKKGKKRGKGKKTGGKKSKKTGSRKKSGKRKSKKTGGCPPAVAHEVKRLVDTVSKLSAENAQLKARKPRKGKKKSGKKRSKKGKSKKTAAKTQYRHHAHGRVSIVTAKQVINNSAAPKKITKAWLCAGVKGTGCGGGGKVIAGARPVTRKGRAAIRRLLTA